MYKNANNYNKKINELEKQKIASSEAELSYGEASALACIAAEIEIDGSTFNHYILHSEAKRRGFNFTIEACTGWFFEHLLTYTTPYDGLSPSADEVEKRIKCFDAFASQDAITIEHDGWHEPEFMKWMRLPKGLRETVISRLVEMGWAIESYCGRKETLYFHPTH
jgi:hypothetical protein